ncbi:hypothetical protein niasHT_005701 [Heterodera trifolii]|uniref:Uncharacterized protein n=1 Tax=Heterodera trifolii TaxID=157864 RepID=A0ABD2M6L8_9BILA
MGAQSASLAHGNGTLFAALGGLCPGFASLHPSRLIRPELAGSAPCAICPAHPSVDVPHFYPKGMCRSSSGTRHASGVVWRAVCIGLIVCFVRVFVVCCLAGAPGSATGRAYGLRPFHHFLHSSNPSGGPSLTKTEPTNASVCSFYFYMMMALCGIFF